MQLSLADQPYAAWINLVGSLCIMIGGPWAVFDGFVPKSALSKKPLAILYDWG